MLSVPFSDVGEPFGSNFMPDRTHFGPDLHRRNCARQIPHAHQVVGGTGEGKDPVYCAHSTMPQLPQQRDRLQPAEAFSIRFRCF